ncbi:flavodoxin domain-containing protein [Corynebacterium pacaense]|uniref:flavodoxin domain-containing protein n=1 Tax=Corynebacterium pacaense TaxID=1816684 RepID=UPI0009B9462B|nr:flavodoxin domain-containing protein [Corynebacterium pacaense]
MTAIIAYASTYGSTAQYAAELGRRLGVAPMRIDAPTEVTGALLRHPGAPLVVLSPVHGPLNAGAKFITDHQLGDRPVALCTVGMTLDEVALEKDGAQRALGARADGVERFYLPGRLNYSELSPAHRSTMWTIIKMLRVKPRKSDNDKMMIDTFDTDVDRVDPARLEKVVQWVAAGKGKPTQPRLN